MKIAICDDDGRFRAQVARSLADFLESRSLSASVSKFRSAEELLTALAGGEDFDFYLLDIIMPGENGVSLARRILARDSRAQILFLTTSRDFAVEAFALGAAHYLVKPFTRDAFAAAVDRILARMPKTRPKAVVLKTSEGLQTVAFDRLVWSETDEHYQHVHLADGCELFVRLSGQDLWHAVEDSGQFVRAGLKFIFNLAHVTGLGHGCVTLTDGASVRVPRRVVPALKESYLRYCCR